jgi:hypothetical protein
VQFTQWLLALEDEDGSLRKFQSIAYSDINNGCSSSRFNALDWKQHFEVKHAENASELISILKVAYEIYVLRESEK